jgi:hypothetical protein
MQFLLPNYFAYFCVYRMKRLDFSQLFIALEILLRSCASSKSLSGQTVEKGRVCHTMICNYERNSFAPTIAVLLKLD